MEKKNIVDSLVGIIQETEEQDKMLQSQNVGWRKELRERFDWTQNTTIKGKVELEKFIQQELDKAREEGYQDCIDDIWEEARELRGWTEHDGSISATDIEAGLQEAYLNIENKLKDNK